METQKFKTNIKCSACVEKVTPYLNETAGSGKWSVDLTDVNRTLTIANETNEAEIKSALSKAGYKAEKIKQ